MKKLYIYAGIAASVVMIPIGITSVAVGLDGRSTVRDELARENIVGTPDMKNVANQKIDTGQEARDFAAGMRVHTLADTGGKTYAEMPRFLDENGQPTADDKAAAIDPKSGEPVANPARDIWVTETALTTALNTSCFGENVSNFVIVMGIALLLAGIGFLVLTLRLPWRDEREAARARAGPGQLKSASGAVSMAPSRSAGAGASAKRGRPARAALAPARLEHAAGVPAQHLLDVGL